MGEGEEGKGWREGRTAKESEGRKGRGRCPLPLIDE